MAKTLDEVIVVSKRKLTSARQELGSNFSIQEAYQALIKGFKTALNIELVESVTDIKEVTEVIDDIIANDYTTLFFDYLLQLLKEKARSLEGYHMSEVYEFEERIKTIHFIKKGIQNNSINKELALTNFILNNFSSHLK